MGHSHYIQKGIGSTTLGVVNYDLYTEFLAKAPTITLIGAGTVDSSTSGTSYSEFVSKSSYPNGYSNSSCSCSGRKNSSMWKCNCGTYSSFGLAGCSNSFTLTKAFEYTTPVAAVESSTGQTTIKFDDNNNFSVPRVSDDATCPGANKGVYNDSSNPTYMKPNVNHIYSSDYDVLGRSNVKDSYPIPQGGGFILSIPANAYARTGQGGGAGQVLNEVLNAGSYGISPKSFVIKIGKGGTGGSSKGAEGKNGLDTTLTIKYGNSESTYTAEGGFGGKYVPEGIIDKTDHTGVNATCPTVKNNDREGCAGYPGDSTFRYNGTDHSTSFSSYGQFPYNKEGCDGACRTYTYSRSSNHPDINGGKGGNSSSYGSGGVGGCDGQIDAGECGTSVNGVGGTGYGAGGGGGSCSFSNTTILNTKPKPPH